MTQYLTLSEDAFAEAIVYAERGDLIHTLATVFKEFGFDLLDPTVTITPSTCEIPMEQWTAICGALQRGNAVENRRRDPIQQANLMLDFVNYGPSAHTEDES